jgi:tol-pal system protein YbgF
MRRLFFALMVIVACSSLLLAQSEETEAAAEPASEPTQQDEMEEASDFVVGLNALNNQIITGLDQLPSRKVIVLPFLDSQGNYSKVSHFLKEQMVTAIVGSQKYQIQNNSELFELISNNNISPMDLGKSEQFQLVKDRYLNVSIVVGSLTDLSKKYAVMSRIIVGSTGNYGGGATVYLRAEEEMAVLMGQHVAQRITATTPSTDTPDDNNAVNNNPSDIKPGLKEIEAPDNNNSSSNSDPNPGAQDNNTTKVLPRQEFTPDVQGKNDLAIYRMGRDMFTRKRFMEAIAYFDKLLELFPESPMADNALYWKGEAKYSTRKWKEAHTIFQQLLDKYPYGNKVPAATLKRGYAEEKLGMLTEAIASMEEVITRFENSEVAVTARRKLQLLRAQVQ